MSYLAILSFDIKGGQSSDYRNLYQKFAELGMSRILPHSSPQVEIKVTTTVLGEFNGTSAESVRDDLSRRIEHAYASLNLRGDRFLSVGGGDWTWRQVTA